MLNADFTPNVVIVPHIQGEFFRITIASRFTVKQPKVSLQHRNARNELSFASSYNISNLSFFPTTHRFVSCALVHIALFLSTLEFPFREQLRLL
jgi:hypothetical protein